MKKEIPYHPDVIDFHKVKFTILCHRDFLQSKKDYSKYKAYVNKRARDNRKKTKKVF